MPGETRGRQQPVAGRETVAGAPGRNRSGGLIAKIPISITKHATATLYVCPSPENRGWPSLDSISLFRYPVKRKRTLVLCIQDRGFAIRADAERNRAVGGKTGATVGVVGKSFYI